MEEKYINFLKERNFDKLEKYFGKGFLNFYFSKATGLGHSVISNDNELFNFFLEKGADIHIRINEKIPLLHAIAFNGNVKMMIQLLKHKIDINEKSDILGETALFSAIRGGNSECVEYLLSKGINPDLLNDEGLSALMLAAEKNQMDIVRLLIFSGADRELLLIRERKLYTYFDLIRSIENRMEVRLYLRNLNHIKDENREEEISDDEDSDYEI